LEGDKLRLKTYTPTAGMPVHGCHFVVCSVCVLLVIIEVFLA
jgi:hypothetical protein